MKPGPISASIPKATELLRRNLNVRAVALKPRCRSQRGEAFLGY
jgi:hypothetical protein